jgi:hypothetical protein
MSRITIKIAALENTRDQLSTVIDKLDAANNQAFSSNIIMSAQHSQINNDVQELRNELAVLNIELINSIVDSITVSSDSPAARIRTSIEQLSIAIDSIGNLRDLLAKITMVISDTQSLINLL